MKLGVMCYTWTRDWEYGIGVMARTAILLFIPQGKPNYKVFNIEYFIEQLFVEKTIQYEIVDSPNCVYCNNIDDIKHFLLSCEKT